MVNGIKYGDYEITKQTTQLSSLCRDLYNECYYILKKLSIKFNRKWETEPTIYTKEIDMNTDRVESYNKNYEINWSLY